MKSLKQQLQATKARITAAPLMNTTILFLFAAPAAVIIYGSFVFNPRNADHPIMYVIQVIVDSISILVLMSLWLTILMDVLVEQHHRLNKGKDGEFLFAKNPTIDVLVTVAGEPIEIIEKTVRAVVAMEYPHHTFILDDGQSPEVKKLAEELKIYYVTRPSRIFAKSGNLNNGLKYCKSEFFAIFDADQVPSKDFLIKLLPYFADPKIGMVQSPQFYGNTDNFIANGTAQAQEIFYKYVCPAKNISNSAFCVGTNVVFRRHAVESIGGIAQLGHSEDIWTSLSLHEHHWQTVFVNEVLAIGRAPETIPSFFKQQLRWAEGGLSMLFFRNPLGSKQLSVDQKVQYFSANFFYLVGFSILAYLIFPILYLLFEIKGLQTESGLVWLLHYLPYFSVYYLLTWLLLGRINLTTISTSLASFYPYLLALFSVVFGTKNTWVATTSTKSGQGFYLKWTWPHFLIIFLTLISLVIGWYNPSKVWVTMYNTGWAVFNLYLLIIFVTAEKREVNGEHLAKMER